MSTVFNTYFNKSELALAAYSDFSSARINGVFDATQVKAALTKLDDDKASDFSAKEAEEFVKRFEVLDQFTDPSGSGFSATVFRNITTKEVFFVNRGTDKWSPADYVTDAILIAGGKPIKQILSMVNYYLRLCAGEGKMADQIGASIQTNENGNEAIAFEFIAPISGVWKDISSFPINVVGHSLGGYLSTIFGYLFGAMTQSVLTCNAPGSWGGEDTLNKLAQLLVNTNPSYASDRQTNLMGDYSATLVPGHKGTDIRLFAEGNSHSQKALTDSLALYKLISELDPTLTPQQITTFLKASSATSGDSLESALDGFRKILLGSTITPSKTAGSEDSQESREAFYTNLYALQESEVFKTLAGKITLVSSGKDLAAAARTDFSALLSLITLSPVTLRATPGNEATLEDKLKAAWSVEYALWQKDQELSAEQRANGEASFSDEYLKDRNTCLTWLIKANTQDAPSANGNIVIKDPASGTSDIVNFIDEQSGQRIIVNPAHPTKRQDIYFGGDGGDKPKAGGFGDDHFYGGAGDDTLSGGAGDDYIWAGDGNDRIFSGGLDDIVMAGAGKDYVYGGDGRDVIDGGQGDDLLDGGIGNRFFSFNAHA